jgi:hypothetical protein
VGAEKPAQSPREYRGPVDRARAIERVIAVLTGVAYIVAVCWIITKAEPARVARLRAFLAELVHNLKWIPTFAMLPSWAKEAAIVRGLAPGQRSSALTVEDAPAEAANE